MASTYLSRTQSASTTRTKFTFSCWVKIASTSGYRYIASSYASNDNRLGFYMHTNYGFTCYARITGVDHALRINLAQHRDVNGWYHFVVKGDSTQSSQADRIKLYTNGVEVTDYQTDSSNNIGSSDNFAFGTTGHTFFIGNYDGTQYMYDGSMSHMHFCDGYAYDASAFGSTDSTTGEWKINTSPNVSYGTNGFFLFKDDNAVTDRSGQGNNFTLGGGTLTKTEDNPSNVFATFNPLDSARNYSGTIDLKNGNTTQQNASDASLVSSLGMNSGKWYAEFKIVNTFNTRTFGIIDISENQGYIGHASLAAANSYAYKASAGNLWNGTTEVASSAPGASAGDIIGIAVDLDSSTKTIKWTLNGSDLTGGTTSINITQSNVTWGFFVRADGGQTISANFGNGYFGTTAVASAGTNASGIGIFEYDVPTGYTALCTKGLNE